MYKGTKTGFLNVNHDFGGAQKTSPIRKIVSFRTIYLFVAQCYLWNNYAVYRPISKLIFRLEIRLRFSYFFVVANSISSSLQEKITLIRVIDQTSAPPTKCDWSFHNILLRHFYLLQCTSYAFQCISCHFSRDTPKNCSVIAYRKFERLTTTSS